MRTKSTEVRMKAIELRRQGLTLKAIAQQLGVAESTISGWVKIERTQGLTALLAEVPHKGKFVGKLDAEKMCEAIARLRKGPIANGFRGNIWSARMVQQFFATEYHVKYSETGALWIIHKYQLERSIRKSLPKQLLAILDPGDIDHSAPPIPVDIVEKAIYDRFLTMYTPGYIQEVAKKNGYRVTKTRKNR